MRSGASEEEETMFDAIVVPLDGSQVAASALPDATTLAETFGARLTLLSVLVPQRKDLGTGDLFDVTSDARSGARGARAMDRYEGG
jgi:nucleotide-binding universal stress UspA family protein